MEILGKLIVLLDTSTGIGANGPWKKKMFVVETKEKYPKKIAFTAWNEQADIAENLAAGAEIKISFSLESREYNGKWYTDVKAWKIETIQRTADGEQPHSSAQQASAISDDAEILPF
jgi:hypothetical protein